MAWWVEDQGPSSVPFIASRRAWMIGMNWSPRRLPRTRRGTGLRLRQITAIRRVIRIEYTTGATQEAPKMPQITPVFAPGLVTIMRWALDAASDGVPATSRTTSRSLQPRSWLSGNFSGQQIPHRHPSAIAQLKKQDVARFHFRFHGRAAKRHSVFRTGIATERPIQFSAVD